MTSREKSIHFGWLEVIVHHYEGKDDAAIKFWNYCIDRYQPDGFMRIEETQHEQK